MGRTRSFIIYASKIIPVTSPDINHGAILVTNGKISDIGRQRDILKRYPGVHAVDMRGRIVLPGLVNVHAHLELSHLKNALPEKTAFFDWIVALVEKRKSSSLQKVKESAAEALREAITTGTTCLGDVASSDMAMPLLIKSGIRAVSFLEVLGMDGDGAKDTLGGLTKRIKKYKGLSDRIGISVSPHSPYSVSPNLFKMLSQYISSNNLSMAIHLSESKEEILALKGEPSGIDGYLRRFGWDGQQRNRGKSPFYLMDGYGFKGYMAVHAVHASVSDIRLMKSSGVSVAYCPRSNYYLNVGRAPVEKFISMGVNTGIGTDSLASNLSMDLWDEMRFGYLLTRLPARRFIEMATINGARALGLDNRCGSLETGKDADLIAVDTDAVKAKDPCTALLGDIHREDIALTMVQGRALHSKDGYIRHEF